jgi:hypothetical protein
MVAMIDLKSIALCVRVRVPSPAPSLRCRKTGAPLCIGSDQDEAQHLNFNRIPNMRIICIYQR